MNPSEEFIQFLNEYSAHILNAYYRKCDEKGLAYIPERDFIEERNYLKSVPRSSFVEYLKASTHCVGDNCFSVNTFESNPHGNPVFIAFNIYKDEDGEPAINDVYLCYHDCDMNRRNVSFAKIMTMIHGSTTWIDDFTQEEKTQELVEKYVSTTWSLS